MLVESNISLAAERQSELARVFPHTINILNPGSWDCEMHEVKTLDALYTNVCSIIREYYSRAIAYSFMGSENSVERVVNTISCFNGYPLAPSDKAIIDGMGIATTGMCKESSKNIAAEIAKSGVFSNVWIVKCERDLIDFSNHYGTVGECAITKKHYYISPNNLLNFKRSAGGFVFGGFNRITNALYADNFHDLIELVKVLEGGEDWQVYRQYCTDGKLTIVR